AWEFPNPPKMHAAATGRAAGEVEPPLTAVTAAQPSAYHPSDFQKNFSSAVSSTNGPTDPVMPPADLPAEAAAPEPALTRLTSDTGGGFEATAAIAADTI